MSNALTPSKELLDNARFLAGYLYAYSPQMAKSLGEDVLLRPFVGELLGLIIHDTDIQVSHSIVPKMFQQRHGIIYKVIDKGIITLEFTDSIANTIFEDSNNLEIVRIYQPGGWEIRLDLACQKSQILNSSVKQVASLLTALSVAYTPEQTVELIEATDNIPVTIKLLVYAYSTSHDTESWPIFGAFLTMGKVKEALLVLETLVQIYPEDAKYRIAFGNMFYGALHNTKVPPVDSVRILRSLIDTAPKLWAPMLETLKKEDTHLYKTLTGSRYESSISSEDERIFNRITLAALDCSYEFARKTAEEQFTEAMRLSKGRNKKDWEQAKQALVALRMIDKMKATLLCPECDSESEVGQQFCGICGARLTVGCPSCGIPADPGARFCRNCGMQMDTSK